VTDSLAGRRFAADGPRSFDVAIVGAGPAGATTALALAHAAPELAARVVLLEKARFPRDKPCAGALGGRGDRLLRSIGVTVDVPSVWVDGISLRSKAGESRARRPSAIGRVVRRLEFDHALARAAEGRGAALRDGTPVDDVEEVEGGVILRTEAGPLLARAVVGCDGVGSVVRRALGGTHGGARAQVIEVDTEPLPGDRDRALLHFDASDAALDGYAWDFPTVVAGRPLVCRGVYRVVAPPRGDPPELATVLADRVRSLGIDPAACRNKRYAERGFDRGATIARGPRMVVGEAAGIDALTGEGIAQAIEYGVLAGRFLAARLAASGPAGALDVSGWQGVVARSRLARDLTLRSWFLGHYRGPRRPDLERFLFDHPEGLALGVANFAGDPLDWAAAGEVAGMGAAYAAAAAIRSLLR
jgi:menaquinone-9 beta-reductase